VADTGIGIPEAAVPHLFAPFTQADSTTTRRFGGTGLGLAIAKSIVELMGGEIGLETREGHGATFWFTAALSPAAAPAPAPACRLPDARILIVDDNGTSRSILERYTRSWGLRPESVADGPGALAALRARQSAGEPFDVAVVDLQMPGMDGAALLREIAGDSSLSAMPVVRLTSTGLLPEGEAAASVRKPVKPAALHECLGRVLRPVSLPVPANPAIPVPSSAAASRGRILIAEDNAVNQRVARLQVRHCGFESDVVSNGEEALDALARMAYTLVLMDCQMPGMDGYAATRELRRREIGARRTPVIAVTANAYATDREACLDAGMDDHLAKPVSIRDLAAMLDRWST
jgi:CheY-like chemotaxis protein